MLFLAAADTLAGVASAASKLTCTISGDEITTSTGADAGKVLYQGQLAASAATIYTVPAGTVTVVKTISVVNTDSSSHTFQLFRGGLVAANAITGTITLPADYMAVWDDNGWHVYSDQGQQLGVGATGAAGSDAANGQPMGLTGAVAATRYVGGTTSGHPITGTFAVGDYVVTQDGSIYICTGAGTSGTWVAVSGGSGLADEGVFTYLDATVAAAPGTPGSGKLRVYAKTGPALAVKDDSGAETVFGAGGLSSDEVAAITGAASPSGANVFATIADVTGGGMTNPMTAGGDLIVGHAAGMDVALYATGARATKEPSHSTEDPANDGNDGSSVDMYQEAGVITLRIDLQTAQSVAGARIKQNASGDRVGSCTVQYSTDDATWYTADTHNFYTSNDDTWSFAAQTARYWQFVATATWWGVYTASLFGAGAGLPDKLTIGATGAVLVANSAVTDGIGWANLVYVYAGAPGSSYVAPLWFDSTSITGGLYCWTGSTYSKIGLATS
jgi:hypothetical protein